MPAWLGVTLAALFGVVAAHRAVRREFPAAVMAAGMAAMPVGMTGIGPHLVRGPWWAAGFAVIALWPLVGRLGAGAPPAGPRANHLPHLLGGAAMVYMCLVEPAVPAAAVADTLAVNASVLSAAEHDHGGGSLVAPPAPAVVPTAEGTPAMLGWALACYFLLATVTMLTRRSADGTLAEPRHALTQAVTGFGTVVMLVAMT